MRAGTDAAIRQWLHGRSAHSDVALPLLKAVEGLPGITADALGEGEFPCILVRAGGRIIGFAEGMQGVSLWLPPAIAAQAEPRGATAVPGLGPDWKRLPLFGPGGFERDLARLVASAAEPFLAADLHGAPVGARVDDGRVRILVERTGAADAAVEAARFRLDRTLRDEGLGEVESVSPAQHEPFAPGTGLANRSWLAVDVWLRKPIAWSRASAFMRAAGLPPGTHVIYTDRMRMCGVDLLPD